MIIENSDLNIVKQRIIEIRLKIEIWDNTGNYITTLEGDVISGTPSINSESDIRRTTTVTLIPNEESKTIIDEQGYIWINKRVRLYIGIKDQRTKEYTWWKQGIYLFTSTSVNYDATNNQMSISCSDLMAELDGSYNGSLGYLSYEYPADEELLMSSWVEEAHSESVDVSTPDKMFAWMSEYHPNVLTKTTIASVKQAAFNLVTVADLSWETADDYIITLRENIRDTIEFNMDDITEGGTTTLIRTITSPNKIRDMVISTLNDLAGITDYKIDDIGEYYAIPENNPDWATYRQNHPRWADLPIDESFSAGSTVLQVLNTFRDLYTFYESYFDVDGVFCMNRIPTLNDDSVTFINNFFEDMLISENTSIDMTVVKNVIKVWGKVLDVDFYKDENITLDETVYKCNITALTEEYKNGDMIGLKLPAASPAGASININNFGNLKIYKLASSEDVELEEGELEAGKVYVFKVYKKRNSQTKQTELKCYYQGQYQPQAIIALVSNSVGEEPVVTLKGTTCKKWSKEYFQDQYDCEQVELQVVPDSPFTCQSLKDELFMVCTGGDFENIQTDQEALERARYELYKSARLPDSISLTTKITPFADVNIKVSYKRSDKEIPEEYIVKSISHDLAGGTTIWSLVHFYQLYNTTGGSGGDEPDINNSTYENLQNYTYNELQEYTYEQIGGGV